MWTRQRHSQQTSTSSEGDTSCCFWTRTYVHHRHLSCCIYNLKANESKKADLKENRISKVCCRDLDNKTLSSQRVLP